MNVGTLVKVFAPFTYSFPEVYTITEIVYNPDETIVYILGDAGGFDAKYLEQV